MTGRGYGEHNQRIARGNQARREAIVEAWMAGLPQRITQSELRQHALKLYLHGELNFRLRQAERARAERARTAQRQDGA